MAIVNEEQQTQVEEMEQTETGPEEDMQAESPFDEEQMKVIEKMIQSREDRVRTEYAKKMKRTEAELDDLKEKHLTDLERLDKTRKTLEEQRVQRMSESEKIEYERQKWLEEKEEWEAEKQRQELEIKRTANKHHAARVIASKGIPAELSDQFETLILDDDTEAIDTKADTILKLAEALAARKVEESLWGRKVTHKTVATTQSTKDFAKMSYKERAKLMEEDPALYDALKNKK